MDSKLNVYEKAVDIARYYGFISIDEFIEALPKESRKNPHVVAPKEGIPGDANRPGIMKAYIEYGGDTLPQPVMIYHTEPLRKTMDRSVYGGKDGALFALEIIGAPRSIAEALLLKVSLTLLDELGFRDDMAVELNSLGDRESIAKFTREFGNYFKRHPETISSHCKNNIRKDIFKVLECNHEKCLLSKENAPKPISTLTEPCREHFKEVLEYLESMNVPYTINNCLVGGKDYYTKTIFEIKSQTGSNKNFSKKSFDKTLARGGRYDDLAKKLGNKKEIPAVGITLTFGGLGMVQPKRKQENKEKKPKVYLIQLGFEAKLRSLTAIEILRKAKIPVYQALSKDRLSAQISLAEKLNIPYMVIIGQKEAYEGTAIVRNMKNRSQETVPLPDLPRIVKTLEKA